MTQPEIHPPTDCRACWEFLFWDDQLAAYVDEEGRQICYPPDKPFGVPNHRPNNKEKK
jgi:hypothetical protein